MRTLALIVAILASPACISSSVCVTDQPTAAMPAPEPAAVESEPEPAPAQAPGAAR